MTTIDVVFDGPPGPVSGRFIEVEDESGAGLKIGDWIEREDGYWVLRLPVSWNEYQDATAVRARNS